VTDIYSLEVVFNKVP